MDYKIRLFFPPRFWNPLPYKVNGKTFRQFVKETEEFTKKVEAMGITTLVADDVALMSKYVRISPREFRDQARLNFFTGNAAALQGIIETINANAKDE